MDVHEDFPLNVPKVIVDVSLFIHIYIYMYFQITNQQGGKQTVYLH